MNVENLLKREGTEWVTPDIPAAIIADINCSPQLAEHKAELIQGARVKYELGILAQRQRKDINDRIERAYVDGLGRQVASFDPEVFHRLEAVQGKNWWRDRKTLFKFLKDNPMFAIRVNPGFTNGRNFSVRVQGLKGSAPSTPAAPPIRRGKVLDVGGTDSRRLEAAA